MQSRKVLFFIFQSIIVGLIVAVTLMFVRPDLFEQAPPALVDTAPTPGSNAPRIELTGPVSYSTAVERAAPSVANIYTAKVVREQRDPFFDSPLLKRFFGKNPFGVPRQRLDTSLGSGVIASAQGYVLTNNHVIDGADKIQVALRDGRSFQATVVGSDPETDIAVLHIEAEDLPGITFGHSNDLRVGDVVLAIGNPFGVGQTVTLGIVSATGRNQLGINTYENFIQTDAAINPGNSGGALINAYGEMIGINTAIFSKSGGSQGIGFAIPVNLAKTVMQHIIKHGRVIRGWLGIEAQDLTPKLLEQTGLKNIEGILITGVLRNGPAHKAGIQPGDIVTHINDQAMTNAKQGMNMIAGVMPDTELKIVLMRKDKKIETTLKVMERPQQITN
ncbi:MAG: trypsin-like peptidase domain-containing protein [Gammaproteobacteria bacterium]|nr:trypsin-like peptidase domain-containing protein [Gammaproteobacteria bacterium]MDH5614812.1 trypsin-like peptidase domain-containing protein [Gammaproteobacteria bacterium]